MKYSIDKTFQKDVAKIKDKTILKQIKYTIIEIKNARFLQEITHLKKLHSHESHWSIRMGDYRMGISLKEDTLHLIRFLHRKDIYRYFP